VRPRRGRKVGVVEFEVTSPAFEQGQAAHPAQAPARARTSRPRSPGGECRRERRRWRWSSTTRTRRAEPSRTGGHGGSRRLRAASARARRRRPRAETTSARWDGAAPARRRARGPYRYFFRLHALDAELELPAGAAKAEVDRARADRALAVAELVGIYERSQSGASSDALALLGLAPAITQRLIAECVRRPATTAWTSPQTTG
jgi:Phosphatidylethanolamine-binding protein